MREREKKKTHIYITKLFRQCLGVDPPTYLVRAHNFANVSRFRYKFLLKLRNLYTI